MHNCRICNLTSLSAVLDTLQDGVHHYPDYCRDAVIVNGQIHAKNC